MKKLLIIIGIVLAMLIMIFVLLNIWTGSILNKKYSFNEEIYGEGKKKALLMYQPSNGDTTKEISVHIAKLLAENDYTVIINTPGNGSSYSTDDYDLIIFGSPVYFGKVSTLLEDYVTDKHITNKNITLFVTGKFTDETKEENEMKNWFDDSNKINTIKTNKDESEKLDTFLKKHYLNN
ncbi:flavodoxin family protein [Enterococcus ureasiticus]|uniref:Flavodoxin domain-containing protein n=1 Tax=Enterococcus ureasiticus TaxID=903984 RepID=A0A1E5GFK1_9ENTE|nr:flavodoxin domain-containing protein [Enterococcus ureasiticus]OEG11427.1 hypothetical protein BCR21_09010 [Enterococcus ureasiticus]